MQRPNDSRIASFVIAAHVLLAVTLAFLVTIDVDETFTLATTAHGPVHATQRAISFELQPPLYFAGLSVWRTLDSSVFHARLFSILCSGLSLVVLTRFVRQFLPNIPLWPVVTLAAFSPVMIYAAIEARCYAMVILLSSLLVWLFACSFMQPAARLRTRIGFAATAIASLYTFYFLGFMLAAGGIILIIARRWRMVGQYILTMVCVAACFAPLALIVNGQVESHTTTVTSPPGLLETLRTVAWQLRNMVLPVDWEPLDGLAKAMWVALAGGTAYTLARKRHDVITPSAVAGCCGYLAIAGCFIVVVRILGGGLIAERHYSLMLIPTVITVSSVVCIAGGRRAMQGFACLAIPFMLASLPVRYPHFAKAGDWQRAADLIMHHEDQHQPVIVFTPAAARAVDFYYQGQNSLVPLPQTQTSDRYAPHEFHLHSPDAVADCVHKASPHHTTLWLILDSEQFEHRGFGAEHLKSYIDQQYDIETRYPLHGSTLLKCNKKLNQSDGSTDRLTVGLQ